MILTVAGIDTADPRELTAALRRECEQMEQATGFADHRYEDSNTCSRAYDGQCDYASYQPCLIAFALAVLDECEKCRHTKTVGSNTFGRVYETGKHELINDIIRTAARAYYGGTLREVSHA